MNGPLVMQFAKFPELGKVKTRLAKDLGNDAALQVHTDLTSCVYKNLTEYQAAVYELWVSGGKGESDIRDAFPFLTEQTVVKRQQGDGLGSRMAGAFQMALKECSQAIIVGSDCPTVDTSYLSAAEAAMKRSDLVLGPSEDGGYVLIGVSRFDARLFEGVEWGTARVLDQTISNAKRLELSYECLDYTWDVDELADYQRWQRIQTKP